MAIHARGDQRFFSDELFALLEAVGDCLLPQDHRNEKIPLAILFERSMLMDKGKGWRYDVLPPMKEAISKGLKGVEEEALLHFQRSFTQLSRAQQEEVLRSVQQGSAGAAVWREVAPALFFEELLAQFTELYYSHPIAKNEIGEIAFADALGWTDVGLQPSPSLPTPPHADQ